VSGNDGDERQGAFVIPFKSVLLRVVASDATDWDKVGYPLPKWEHVSVSLGHRTPTWEELEFIRLLWWRDDETVIQLHVPVKNHINFHPYCLHLWKPIGVEIPLPPTSTVGPESGDDHV
jgi:hypothetical protein